MIHVFLTCFTSISIVLIDAFLYIVKRNFNNIVILNHFLKTVIEKSELLKSHSRFCIISKTTKLTKIIRGKILPNILPARCTTRVQAKEVLHMKFY